MEPNKLFTPEVGHARSSDADGHTWPAHNVLSRSDFLGAIVA